MAAKKAADSADGGHVPQQLCQSSRAVQKATIDVTHGLRRGAVDEHGAIVNASPSLHTATHPANRRRTESCQKSTEQGMHAALRSRGRGTTVAKQTPHYLRTHAVGPIGQQRAVMARANAAARRASLDCA